MNEADDTKRLCPFVKENRDECYFTKMNSLNIWAVVNFCSGNFEKCRIYKKLSGVVVNNS